MRRIRSARSARPARGPRARPARRPPIQKAPMSARRRGSGRRRPVPRPRPQTKLAGQRRNGLPALTCITTSGVSGPSPAAASRASTLAPGRRILGHLERVIDRRWRRDAQRRQQVPLVLDRVARPQFPSALDGLRVHPAAAGDPVAESLARPGEPREPRAARPAVKIDDQVEPSPGQRASQSPVVGDAAPGHAIAAPPSPRRGEGCRAPPAPPALRPGTSTARRGSAGAMREWPAW